jgi:hypothetical protein
MILGSIGFLRVLLWPSRADVYGPHFALVGATVAVSLVWIVMWGAVAGSMLPFLLRRLGFDPASASAPFVATLVDVTGLVIYFSVATCSSPGAALRRGRRERAGSAGGRVLLLALAAAVYATPSAPAALDADPRRGPAPRVLHREPARHLRTRLLVAALGERPLPPRPSLAGFGSPAATAAHLACTP